MLPFDQFGLDFLVYNGVSRLSWTEPHDGVLDFLIYFAVGVLSSSNFSANGEALEDPLLLNPFDIVVPEEIF